MKTPREQFWEAVSLVSLTLFFYPPKMLSVLSEESAGINCNPKKGEAYMLNKNNHPNWKQSKYQIGGNDRR